MLYYAYGNALLTAEEVFDPSVFPSVKKFFDELRAGQSPDSVELSTGMLSVDNAVKDVVVGGDVPWTPIGPGLPLTLMIREVYTGRYPKTSFITKKKPMLVTSAVKSIVMPEAKPRALNILKKEVTPKSFPMGAATEPGVPLIFYSPALLEMSLKLDLSMSFDDFNQEVFDQIGDLFSQAAGIPLFVTQSFYLIAAGMITKLVGKIGEAIFDPSQEFSSSDQLNINLPGSPALPAGFVLVTSDDLGTAEAKFRADHHIGPEGRLLKKDNTPYDGDVPYMVISADGRPDEELKKFTPTAVSAAVISRFFSVRENQSLPLDIMIDALKLYNDIKFRSEIERIDDQIKAIKDDDPEKEKKKADLQKKKNALLANILEERLKPKA